MLWLLVTLRQVVRLKWLLLLLGLALVGHSLYLPAKAVLAQELLNAAWEQTQRLGEAVKPWPWADTWPVAKIEFPDIEEDFIVLSGSMGRTLAFGPGHMDGSSLPGEAGHVIISAHRDSHFQHLDQLRPGQIIRLETALGEWRDYVIQASRVVDSRYEPLLLESDEDLLTLITCYPFDAIQAGGPLRYRLDALPLEKS